MSGRQAIKTPVPLDIGPTDSLVLMTGAGISAESGIPTFRDQGGLWHEYDISEVATPEGFARNPSLVWEFYSNRREQALKCEPNAGHHAISTLLDRQRASGSNAMLVTQNVDGLHERAATASTEDLVRIHGSLFRTRCSSERCELEAYVDTELYYGEIPRCALCASMLRPGVVWFGEMLGFQEQRSALEAIQSCDWFITVGTSGTVYPVAGYVNDARRAGARTVLVNLDAPDNVYFFDEFYQGRAAQILPILFGIRA